MPSAHEDRSIFVSKHDQAIVVHIDDEDPGTRWMKRPSTACAFREMSILQ
jgi:hypothetical protein